MRKIKVIILLFFIAGLYIGCNDDSEKDEQQVQQTQIPTLTKLPPNEWYIDSIASVQTKHYYFDAIEGKQYKIQTDSFEDGTGVYTALILIIVVNEDRTYQYGIAAGDAYSFPMDVTALKTEKIIIDVQNYLLNAEGELYSFAIRYEEL